MEEFITPMYVVVFWGCSLQWAKAWFLAKEDAVAYAEVLNKDKKADGFRVALVATRMIISVPSFD